MVSFDIILFFGTAYTNNEPIRGEVIPVLGSVPPTIRYRRVVMKTYLRRERDGYSEKSPYRFGLIHLRNPFWHRINAALVA